LRSPDRFFGLGTGFRDASVGFLVHRLSKLKSHIRFGFGHLGAFLSIEFGSSCGLHGRISFCFDHLCPPFSEHLGIAGGRYFGFRFCFGDRDPLIRVDGDGPRRLDGAFGLGLSHLRAHLGIGFGHLGLVGECDRLGLACLSLGR
jgi:hypothetical protein